MPKKDEILKIIADLKAEKPDHWKSEVRWYLRWLAKLEDPYGGHEDHGSERRGRSIHRTDGCPLYDRMGDESRP